MPVIHFVALVAMLALNAFFVLAEFAAVKVRPTRVDELAEGGNASAKILQEIQARLDEYLSTCQVGITLASVGLGFVGEAALAEVIEPALGWAGGHAPALAHSFAIAVAYASVSYLHVVLGELVPKSIAIRATERAALVTARPLKFFHTIFYVPLVILNGSANFVTRLLGVHASSRAETHTEHELRTILERSQSTGVMSFRRLLLLENVLDLGALKVRDAMRSRSSAKVVRTDAPWAETLALLREHRLSRYPVVAPGQELPIGILHVKDLLSTDVSPERAPDLSKLVRPAVVTTEEAALETLLPEFQRRRAHLAVVVDRARAWTGIISLEDVLEEIVGKVEDEFETEPPVSLADAIGPGRVVLGIDADSLEAAVRVALERVPGSDLPLSATQIAKALEERERLMSTYLGRGIAIPHARLEGIDKPVLVVARSERGVPIRGAKDRAHLIFVLLTPAGTPRVHVRLLARLAAMLESSEFVVDRLREATAPAEVVEAIRAGETASLA